LFLLLLVDVDSVRMISPHLLAAVDRSEDQFARLVGCAGAPSFGGVFGSSCCSLGLVFSEAGGLKCGWLPRFKPDPFLPLFGHQLNGSVVGESSNVEWVRFPLGFVVRGAIQVENSVEFDPHLDLLRQGVNLVVKPGAVYSPDFVGSPDSWPQFV